MARLAGKLIALLVLSCAFYVAYSLSDGLVRWAFGSAFKMPLQFTVGTSRVDGLFSALVWGGVFALPLAWLGGRFAFLAGLACVAPVILMAVVAYAERPRPPSALLYLILFIVTLATVVPFAAQAAYWMLGGRAR